MSVQPLIDMQHAFRILGSWQAALQAIPASVRSRAGQGISGVTPGELRFIGQLAA